MFDSKLLLDPLYSIWNSVWAENAPRAFINSQMQPRNKPMETGFLPPLMNI